MTTTVKILIEGNKACEVCVSSPEKSQEATVVLPGTFTTKLIHGNLQLTVKETGDFLA